MSAELKKYLKVILLLLSSTAIIMFFVPPKTAFPYEYEVGVKWDYETLYSDVEFPILKSESQIASDIEAAAAGSIPCYRFDEEIGEKALGLLEEKDFSARTKSDIRTVLDEFYKRGILADNSRVSSNNEIYIQRDKRIVRCDVSEIFRPSTAQSNLAMVVSEDIIREKGLDELVRPNLIFDPQLTEQMKEDNIGKGVVSDGYVSVGDIIVRKGELVTPELVQILNSYREEYYRTESQSTLAHLLLSAILVLTILVILFLVVYIISPEYILSGSFLYILTIFIIFTIAILLVSKKDENLLLMFPFTLIALLLQAFFRPKLVIPLYFVCLLPLAMFCYSGADLYILFIIPGIVSVALFKYFCKGWKQFLLALIIFAILAFLSFITYACGHTSIFAISSEGLYLYLFVGSFLTVAGYPLVYLFEKIFNLVSSSKLIEISDTSSSLIRQLESKAPGTLQHSLQVMNMADSAARSIGADSLLLRAGALYHDIGKMNNPMCFVENESVLAGDQENRYHSDLPAVQSAEDIIRHVSDGVEIARKNHLPDIVVDFIRSHHGTTLVKYFYVKHIDKGGNASDEPLFRYKGMKPRTKEQVILMLCDSVEAASRTLKEYTPEAYDSLLSGIINGKYEDGQFEDADISIRELRIIKESMISYLTQMHHERIVYPTRNNNTKK